MVNFPIPDVIFLYIVYYIYRYLGPVVISGTCVEFMCKLLNALLRPHTTHYTILHSHLSERCSVPDVQPRTPGALRVRLRRCTRVTLGVVRCGEPHVPWYHAIYGGVAYDMYAIYMSYVSLGCVSCCPGPTRSLTYTQSASCSTISYH